MRGRTCFAALALLTLVVGSGCGARGGPPRAGFGTLSVANQSHLTMAPATIQELFIVPEGASIVPANQLAAPVGPGGIVIVGLYPEGMYDAAVVLDGGLLVPFNGIEIRPDAPTTLTYP